MPRNVMASTTASAAPELIPRIPGPASGLRVMPCMTAPAIPNAVPARMPVTVRGIRMCTMIRSRSVVAGRETAVRTSPMVTEKFPIKIDASAAPASAQAATASPSRRPQPPRKTPRRMSVDPVGVQDRRDHLDRVGGADPGGAVREQVRVHLIVADRRHAGECRIARECGGLFGAALRGEGDVAAHAGQDDIGVTPDDLIDVDIHMAALRQVG